jgi:urocanate hydratase
MTKETRPQYTDKDIRGMIKHAGAGNETAIDWANANGLDIDEQLAEQALNGDEVAWRLLIQRNERR